MPNAFPIFYEFPSRQRRREKQFEIDEYRQLFEAHHTDTGIFNTFWDNAYNGSPDYVTLTKRQRVLLRFFDINAPLDDSGREEQTIDSSGSQRIAFSCMHHVSIVYSL